ncbi:MAG: hypothetical protein JXR76_30275 [Deltaproteobacteria bacterium]|nr:hypothetical protein [Deltaproteobacteria bacterium]
MNRTTLFFLIFLVLPTLAMGQLTDANISTVPTASANRDPGKVILKDGFPRQWANRFDGLADAQ